MKLVTFIAWILGLLVSVGASAQAPRPDCDSCDMAVHSLDKPLPLTGRWLFTRDDAPANKDVQADTSRWVTLKTPGPWKKAYNDGRNFEVGWYRANLHFDRSLVGKEVVLLVNTYMARMDVFLDGQPLYQRPDENNVHRYYSIQSVPVRFKVTQPTHVFAMRVDTPLMTGVYQLPFELREYSPHDAGLVGYQVWGGEMRLVVGFVSLFFGLFFGLVYAKTRYPMYLMSALSCVVFIPFCIAPSDSLLGIFKPETLLYLHYLGLMALFFFYPFSQFFDTFRPKTNWVMGVAIAGMGLTIGSMAIHPNLELFQHVRSIYFVSLVVIGLLSIHSLVRAVRNKRQGARILLAAMVTFVVFGTHDMLLALGAISSISLIFTGTTAFLAAMLYVSSTVFADTFVQNKQLVRDLQGMNDNLEGLVAERTAQLRQKTQDIESMLQNMPQGVLTVMPDQTVHPEYSAYLETILEASSLGGRPLLPLLFEGAQLSNDELSQVEASLGSCIGEDRMNFDFNSHLLPAEFDRRLPDGRVKSLALSWSPICDDSDVVEKLMICVRDVTELKRLSSEASRQRRELEVIGQVLAVSQEKFHEFVRQGREFLARNRELGAGRPDTAALQEMFRNMHTIKGNARTYGLVHVAQAAHDAEQALDQLRNGSAEFDAPALAQGLDSVAAAIDEVSRVNDETLGRRGPGRRGGVERFLMVEKQQLAASLNRIRSVDPEDAAEMRSVLREVGQALSLIGTESLEQMLAGTVASLPALAVELGKEAPTVRFHDSGVRLRTQAGGPLRNAFTHALRNAVDHGLETAAVRAQAGKPAAGRIDIGVTLDPQAVRITVRDDGRGLGLAAIHAKAVERGLVAADAKLSDDEVAAFIFHSGLSTAEKLTEVSGRGVGMDAVREFLRAEGGDVRLRLLDAPAAPGFRAFELVVTLPARFGVRSRDAERLSELPEFAHTLTDAHLATV